MFTIFLVPVFICRRHAGAPTLVVCAAVALGFGVAQLRTAQIDAPVINRKLGPVAVEGLMRPRPRMAPAVGGW